MDLPVGVWRTMDLHVQSLRDIRDEMKVQSAVLAEIRDELQWLFNAAEQVVETETGSCKCAHCGVWRVIDKDNLCRVCAQLPDVEEEPEPEVNERGQP